MKPLLVNDPVVVSRQSRFHTAADSVSCPDFTTPVSGLNALAAARARIFAAVELADIQNAVAECVRQLNGSILTIWYRPASGIDGEPGQLEGLLISADGMTSELREQLRQLAVRCLQQQTLQQNAISNAWILYGLPVPAFPGHCLLLVAESSGAKTMDRSSLAGSLQILGALINEWSLTRRAEASDRKAETTAALMELLGQVQACDDVQTACQRLVDLLKTCLGAAHVAVGLCRSGALCCRLEAVSGEVSVDHFSEHTRLVEAVLQESIIRAGVAAWPVMDRSNRHALLAHQQLVESGFGSTVITMPMTTETGHSVGSLLVSFDDGPDQEAMREQTRLTAAFLRAGNESLAGCLCILQKLADSRLLNVAAWWRRTTSGRATHLAAWGTVFAIGILAIPMPYHVDCTLELQPVHRHFVAAPFDAPLAECLVEPGDVVAAGQLLARLDGREIRWELAEAEASLNKATRERNTQLNEREFGKAAVTAEEIERLKQRTELLQHRDAGLEVRSPAEGVVVSGDHREAIGVPLKTGQTLFEIAPLNSMVVELFIPEEDIRHVQPEMEVYVRFDAVPEQPVTAPLRMVHPAAEIRDGQNVFIGETTLSNESRLLRPGMKGDASIRTDRHSLGWILFHKPALWLLGWLGW